MPEALKNRPLPDEKIGGDDAELLRVARERYQKAVDHDQENREAAVEDLEFLAGDMWPEEVRRDREEDRRPVLSIDRVSQAVAQVAGDIRQNSPAIKVRPADDVADKDRAEIYTGLIRHIEAQSDASIAYVTAGESAAQCGIGHFRIVTEYSTDDTFDQDIRIRRIPDAFSVTWDPHAIEITREDARYCFVEESLDIESFKARYPDASLQGFDGNAEGRRSSYLEDWYSHETVRVAEYWTRTPEKRTLALIQDGRTLDVTEMKPVDLAMLGEQAQGVEAAYVTEDGSELLLATRTRKVFRDKVEMRIIAGAEVLEGPFEWPGRFIPVVPVIGEEIHIQNKTVRFGMVRRAKDPQRLYNIWRSAQTEKIALEPKAPWLVTAANINGYEHIWQQANVRNLPYLPWKPDAGNGNIPPQRVAPQLGSAAMAADIGLAADDIKATTRVYNAGLGERSNETTGKAIIARQRESDNGTFVFIDNLTRALRRAGTILVDLIPRIYDTERTVRILNEDGTHDVAVINQTITLPDGTKHILNDVSVGKYDVVVVTGPAYTTRRAEAADGMMQLAQAVPDKAALFLDILVKNLDWPGADEIAARLRKTLPPGLAEPEEGEEPMPEQPPPPEAIEAQAKAETMQREQARKEAETASKIAKTEVEAESTRLDNVQKAMQLALQDGTLQAIVQEQVEAALARMMPQPAVQPVEQPIPVGEGDPGWLDMGDGVRVRPVENAAL